VAEDNLVNRKLAIGLLTSQGHSVTVVENGQQAIDAVVRGSFDVVLMDVQMPVLGGLEATRIIREREREGSTRLPIIAMTARAMQGDRERCFEAGMDGYVSKPIRREKLFAEIQALVATRGTCSPGDRPVRLDELRELLEGDDALVDSLIALFIDDAPKLLGAATDALRRGDVAAAGNSAHALKGSAGNIRAHALEEAAARLEHLAAIRDVSGAEKALALLTQEHDITLAALREYRAAQAKARGAADPT
jgi:protein-histidine pros-kinase